MILNNPYQREGCRDAGMMSVFVNTWKTVVRDISVCIQTLWNRESVLSVSHYSMGMSCRDMYLSEKSELQFFPEFLFKVDLDLFY